VTPNLHISESLLSVWRVNGSDPVARMDKLVTSHAKLFHRDPDEAHYDVEGDSYVISWPVKVSELLRAI
jgi:hypothetical protein